MIVSFLLKLRGWLAFVPREVWYLLAAGLLVWWIDARAYDRGYAARTAEYEKAARKAQEVARAADEEADTQRGEDDARNQENDDARNDAIDNAGRLGLNCQRLRSAGYREADLPEPCRR